MNLNLFRSTDFDKGAGFLKRLFWYYFNIFFFNSYLLPFNNFKKFILIMFGAKIGTGLIIRPNVNIKFPWKLEIGDNVWIGENTWIDNLDKVIIGDNVCISQGAMLLTGNHDYSIASFDYRNAPIIIEVGVWIGAKTVVCPGVTCKSHSILTVGSIATKDLETYRIYQGNPAKFVRERKMK